MEKSPDIIEIFKKMCFIRYFELKVIEASKKGLIPGAIYLSVGQEAISSTVSTIAKKYSIFSQHRCHSIYLAHGGDPVKLIDELLGRPTGCCKGKGGSPCIQDLSIPMYGHHGLIGENIPLATGYALATNRPTICYFGDAAGEEDYALSSLGFAVTHKLPVLYVCEDNDLSILTKVSERRSWNIYDVAKAMGMKSEHITDDPKLIFETVKKLISDLPAFINVKTSRHLWHVGHGSDGPSKVDRLDELRHIIQGAGEIEKEISFEVANLWQRQLQKQ